MKHQLTMTDREVRLVAGALRDRLAKVREFEESDKRDYPTLHSSWTGDRMALEAILKQF